MNEVLQRNMNSSNSSTLLRYNEVKNQSLQSIYLSFHIWFVLCDSQLDAEQLHQISISEYKFVDCSREGFEVGLKGDWKVYCSGTRL